MPKYDELIEQAQANVNTLGEKLKDLDKLHQDIISLKTESESIPLAFEQNFQKISNLWKQYTETLGSAAKTYLDGSNSLFTTKLNDFSEKNIKLENEVSRLVNTDLTKSFSDLQKVFIEQTQKDLEIELTKIGEKTTEFHAKINDLQKEVNRLVDTDLTELFNNLQKKFIEQAREDLAAELIKIDERTTEFQTKITNFGGEINRLEKVDLEKGFDKLQKTLSDIFGSINSINQTLTVVTQTLNSIVQSLGIIQTSIDTNHKEIKQNIDIFSESTTKHLTNQDQEAKSNYQLLETKINSISEQNDLLRKEINTNRIIQIVGLTLVVIILIYLVIFK